MGSEFICLYISAREGKYDLPLHVISGTDRSLYKKLPSFLADANVFIFLRLVSGSQRHGFFENALSLRIGIMRKSSGAFLHHHLHINHARKGEVLQSIMGERYRSESPIGFFILPVAECDGVKIIGREAYLIESLAVR